MIASETEYERAQEELKSLQERLQRLEKAPPPDSKPYTKAGVRKMIARLREEMASFRR